MIRALSPYYVEIPLQYTYQSSTYNCEYFKLKIKVWSGNENSVPSTVDYTIVYENTNSDSGSHSINIAPLLRDFIEFETTTSTQTFNVFSAFGNQKWVNYSVTYDDVATSGGFLPDTKLFSLGYTYGTDGLNAENRGDDGGKPQVLLDDVEYSIHRGSFLNVPISLEDITTSKQLIVRSYPSSQLYQTRTISTTTSSDSMIKNVWFDTSSITTDDYIRVTYNGDTIEFVLKDEYRFNPMTVFFINKYGAQQTFMFLKEQRQTVNVTDNVFESNIGQPSTGSHQFLRYNVQARTSLKASTGFIDESENEAVKQMLLSERVWMYDNVNTVVPLNIKTTSTEFKSRQKERLINYDIEFLMSYNDINNI